MYQQNPLLTESNNAMKKLARNRLRYVRQLQKQGIEPTLDIVNAKFPIDFHSANKKSYVFDETAPLMRKLKSSVYGHGASEELAKGNRKKFIEMLKTGKHPKDDSGWALDNWSDALWKRQGKPTGSSLDSIISRRKPGELKSTFRKAKIQALRDRKIGLIHKKPDIHDIEHNIGMQKLEPRYPAPSHPYNVLFPNALNK